MNATLSSWRTAQEHEPQFIHVALSSQGTVNYGDERKTVSSSDIYCPQVHKGHIQSRSPTE